jgi:hypothetical protein
MELVRSKFLPQADRRRGGKYAYRSTASGKVRRVVPEGYRRNGEIFVASARAISNMVQCLLASLYRMPETKPDGCHS